MASAATIIDRNYAVNIDRGRVGMACLILTESALFAIFVTAYIFFLGKSISGPQPKDVLSIPVWATICLLSSSITAELALHSLEGDRLPRFRLWLGATILLGAEFLRQTALEWRKLIEVDHLTISTNIFGTTYYSLVGLHATHVTIGVLLLLIVMIFALWGTPVQKQSRRFRFLSWYWHFVDAVWVVVLTTVYFIGR